MEYTCKNCKEEWECADFLDDIDDYLCPLCSMPVTQMIHDTYKEGGIKEVLRMLKLRYL